MVAEYPGDGHLSEGLAAGLGDVVECADTLEIVFAEKIFREGALFAGAGVLRDGLEIFVGEQALAEGREGDAADAEVFERGEEFGFDPAVEHGVGGLMNEERDALLVENLCGFDGELGAVGGDADVEGFALVDGLDECAHGFFERDVGCGAMGVEDVDVVETHAVEAVVERGEEIFARAADAVGAGPHVPTGLGGDEELVAVRAEIFVQDRAEVFFG